MGFVVVKQWGPFFIPPTRDSGSAQKGTPFPNGLPFYNIYGN